MKAASIKPSSRVAQTTIQTRRKRRKKMVDKDQNVEELVNWLCWSWATDGERFYPPDETARECVDEVEKTGDNTARAWEEGYHSRAYTEAVERFEDLKARGFDPVERTERHLEEARNRGLDLPDIDWEWWETTQDQEE